MDPERNSGEDEYTVEQAKIDGIHWLKLLGKEELIGQPIPYYDDDGRQRVAEEFPLLDHDAVRPIFTLIESLPEDDPKRQDYIDASIEALDYYLNKPLQSTEE